MKRSVLVFLTLILAAAGAGGAAPYTWPLSGSTTPDSMNTSFGPRLNYSAWDMHPGMDLPGVLGTPLYASRDGTVFLSGASGTDGYDNRHVSILTNDPTDGTLYLIFMHLDTIDAAVTVGAPVTQGQLIGTLGADGATYPHCHYEFRKGSPFHEACVHPLKYLPYTDSANFTAPVADRANRRAGGMNLRLLFGAPDKNEGDLIRVEVDLRQGLSLLSTRVADFNDRTTMPVPLPYQSGDQYIYTNDIGVEGYQTSNMVLDGRTDLKEGILVRNLPPACDNLVARVYDMGGNVSTSAAITVVNQAPVSEFLDFEGGGLPGSPWATYLSGTGTGTTVVNSTSANYSGSRGISCRDYSTSETAPQVAAVELFLPPGRFEWLGEAWINPVLGPVPGQDVYTLAFFDNSDNLCVAARIRNAAGVVTAGLSAQKPDSSLTGKSSAVTIADGVWHKWTLALLRVATRETTAVLYIDGVEACRISWDSGTYLPEVFRAGIALNGTGTTAEISADEVRIVEDADEVLAPQATTTVTRTATRSLTFTPTRTPTWSPSRTVTPTLTPSATASPILSATASASHSPSRTSTPTVSPSPSPSGTVSATRSATPSMTRTAVATSTNLPTSSFTVSPTPPLPTGVAEAYTYPEPASDKLTFVVPLGTDSVVTIKIYDWNGRFLWERSDVYPGSGGYAVLDADTRRFAPGIYFYQVEMVTPEKIEKSGPKKFMIIHPR